MISTNSYNILNIYSHDEEAFTEGLIYHNNILYESTGDKGTSTLRQVELKTGKVIKSLKLDDSFHAEGITLWQDQIIQLTWQEKVGFVYDQETFEKLRDFHYCTEGWGITHDGQRLIMSDGTDKLHFLDPHTFKEICSVQVRDQENPLQGLNELEYINGEVFAHVSPSDNSEHILVNESPQGIIARISPETGLVLGSISLSKIYDLIITVDKRGLATQDVSIAHNKQNEHLYITGKFWPKLVEIKLVPNEEAVE